MGRVLRQRGGRRPLVVLPFLIVASLAVVSMAPATAFASSVSIFAEEGFESVTQSTRYTADAGETNELHATSLGQTITVTDHGTTASGAAVTITTTDPACTVHAPGNSATCAMPYPLDFDPTTGLPVLTSIDADLGDMNDSTPGIATDTAIQFLAFGGPGDDHLRGGPANDQLYGDCDRTISACLPGGNDLLEGGPDRLFGDFMNGVAGIDTVTYADRPADAPVVVELPVGGRGIAGGPGEGDTVDGIENIIGGQGNDTLTGGPTANVIDGGPGADVVAGGVGEDTIDYSGLLSGSSRADPVYVSIVPGTQCDTALDEDRDGKVNDGCPVEGAETGAQCERNFDDDLDGKFNEGCPPVGSPETGAQCDNRDDDDGDLKVNDGCPEVGSETGAQCDDAADSDSDDRVNEGCFAFGKAREAADDGSDREQDDIAEDVENVRGGLGNDTLIGGDPKISRDPLLAATGENQLYGGPGNDTLDGRLGPDLLSGGGDEDTVTYEDRDEPVTATIDHVGDDGGEGDYNPITQRQDTILEDIETVIGGSGDDVLVGSDDGDHLDGKSGNDEIRGAGGNDDLLGSDGGDALEGGEGDDSLSGQAGGDSLNGDAGNDGLDGGPDGDYLAGGTGPDSIGGGDGNDLVDYSAALTPVHVNPNGVADDGAGEGDNVSGDVESVAGGGDNDTLIGGGGNGTINGGGGDDVIDGGGGADDLIGSGGVDTASYAGRSAPVNASLDGAANDGEGGEGDNVTGSVEKLTGGAANDTLIGDGAANVLSGGGGNDSLGGSGGADLLLGGGGADSLNGEAGPDQLEGNEGNDALNGGDDSDTLAGGDGDDSLDGGAGGDAVGGGGGDDTANYGGRSAAVIVTLNGSSENGEAKESDLVRTDVESVTTGRGNDQIDSRDGVAGRIACGAGRDRVRADASDKIAADCEEAGVGISSRCSIRGRSLKMSRRGTIGVRVTCPVAARATLTLRRSKAGSARKSFRARAGRRTTVKVKLPRKARRLVQRRKRLSFRATVVSRPTSGAGRRQRANRTLTIRK